MTLPVIGYVGLTHLGLNSAAAGAERGCHVVGFDPNDALARRLAEGETPLTEPQLPELLAKNLERLEFTSDPSALKKCDIVYVAPDVATDDSGNSDLGAINTLLKVAFENAGTDATIVILSQVPPGFTHQHHRKNRLLFYQVETLVFGRAIERALNPERFIIGAREPNAPLPCAYQKYLDLFSCPLLVMRYESAELAKISINCCLVASINVANMLAELCENIGADWSEIAPALKLDQRIGPHAYLSPGLGIAGGNLERDLNTVQRFANDLGTDAGVVSAWLANSKWRKDWPYRTLCSKILGSNPKAKIALLGITYKEDTNSVKNSPSLELISRLSEAMVTAFDPAVPHSVVPQIDWADDMYEAIQGADAVAIMTPWSMFRNLDPRTLVEKMNGTVVLDPYGVLDRKAAIDAGLDYTTLGVSSRTPD